MRCRASTSAPATVAAHRSRNDGDAAVPSSASAPPLRIGGAGGLQQRGRRAADQHGGHGGVLAAHLLLRRGHGHRVGRRPQQRGGRGGERGALQGKEHVDDRRVRGADPLGRERGAGDRAPQRGQVREPVAGGGVQVRGRRSELGGRQGAAPPPRPRRPADLGVELVAARAAPARDVSLGEQPLTLQGVDEPGDLLTRTDLADQRVERTGVVVGRHDAQRAERADHEQRDDQHRGQLRAQPPVPQPPAAPIAHCGSPSGPPDGRPHGATPGRDRRHLVAGRPSSGRNRSGLRPDGPVPLRQLSGHPRLQPTQRVADVGRRPPERRLDLGPT